MFKETGSNFWDYSLNQENRKEKLWWEEDGLNRLYLKSGRNAILYLCRLLCKFEHRVLLPVYTCETVIQPFYDETWNIDYYPVNSDLTLNKELLTEKVSSFKPSVILFHSYFGFDTLSDSLSLIEEFHEKGINIIEDITQSIFSCHHIPFADYYVGSLRKFLAIPCGGVVVSERDLPSDNFEGADESIPSVALKAFDEKKTYMSSDSADEKLKEKFRNYYIELNSIIANNDEVREIDSVSKKIWESCDISLIRERRKQNYERVLNGISGMEMLEPVLPPCLQSSSPLYLPVYASERRKLQYFMASNSVYCPIIWPLSSQISTLDCVSLYMYNHMLCIPVDQRYGNEEMDRILNLLHEYRSN